MTISTLTDALGRSEAWRRFTGHPEFEDVPVAPVSFPVIAKLAVDELLRGWFDATSPEFWVRRGEVAPAARREVDALLELYGARGWIADPRSFHVEPPALERVEVVSGRRGHHRFEHLRFESGYKPHPDDPVRERWQGYTANRTAHAWMLRHTVPEDRPWLVCLHGMGMGSPYVDFPAFRRSHLYEALGFNVLWYVKPFHGPRARGTASHETFARGVGNLVQVQAQTIWDLRRILGWIRRQGGSRIGVYGLSLGGFAASLLSALSDELDLVVAGIPGTDFIDLLEQNVRGSTEEAECLAPFWRDAREAMRVVSPMALPCRVARERRFIFGGLVDRLTGPEGVRRLWLHWERPRIAWYPGGHVSFLLEPAVRSLLDEAFACLDRPPDASS